MAFIISQVLGIVVSASAIASMQLKNVKLILVFQLICNTLGAAGYILVGGLSGCGIYLVALVQSVLYFVLRAKNVNTPSWLAVVFVIGFLLCSVFTFKDWRDVFSAIAAVTCALAISQEKPSLYRVFMLLNGIIWMTYDFSVGAYTMIISHAATAVSALVGMLRLDRKTSQS